MVAYIFPLNFSTTTTITVFIIFFIWSASNGYAYDYDKCSSTWSCGNVTNISFPFLWPGRPFYCGHPALQLQCIDYFPVLLIDDPDVGYLSFQVLGIWDTNSSFTTIKLLHMPPQSEMQPHPACPIDFIKYGVSAKYLFKYSSNVGLALFMGCSEPVHNNKTLSSDLVTCSDVDGHPVWAYYLHNQSDSRGPDGSEYEGCNGVQDLHVPVLKEELNKFQQGKETLEVVFSKGFEVELDIKYSQACIKCLLSGGDCGPRSSDQQLVCTCKNRNYTNVCPRSGDLKMKLALGLGIPGGFCILIALNVALCCYMKKNKFQTPALLSKTFSYYHRMSDLESGYSFCGIPVFSYKELQEATNNFDSAQELGDGGFGVVYYGKLRDGREVAVKRLYEKNYKRVGQFMNEVEILTKLRHQNLVTLYGCTSRHSRELLLVYEYISNGTVADHLFGEQSRSRTLPWSTRMKIAIQTASALSYLHASDIIHRDVKTNNILVDDNFTVKVADFGLSRLFPCDATHVSTAPHGTPGYLDPEYHKCYQVSSKSDVYSFGVVLIELISSLPAIDISRHEDEINLSDYAMNRIQNGELEALVDRNLGFESDFKVKRMTTLVAELAFRCLQQEKEVRPSMEEVFEALKLIENVDYDALESEEMSWDMGILKPTSMIENGVSRPRVAFLSQ